MKSQKKIVVLFFTLLIALTFGACGSKLSAPSNVKVSGDLLVWDSVSGASAYHIRVNGGTLLETTDTSISLTSGLLYDEMSFGENKLKVRSVKGDDYSDFSSEVAYTKPARVLGIPNVTINEEETGAIWNNVSGAIGYKIKIDETELSDVYSATEYLFENIEEIGKHTIAVKAVGDGTATTDSAYSIAVDFEVFSKDLTPIVTPVVVVNETTGIASWAANKNGFKIKIDGIEQSEIYSENSYKFEVTKNGTYTIAVKALGDRVTTKDSIYSETASYTLNLPQLTAPTISLTGDSGNIVSWAAVADASGYQVQIYNDAAELVKTSGVITETSYTLDITTEGAYSICVITIGNGNTFADSEPSDIVTYNIGKLTAPTIEKDNKVVSWNNDENASSYKVILKLDGENFAEYDVAKSGSGKTTYIINVTQNGTYTITVIAIGNGKNYLNSDESNSVDYEFNIVQLATPVVTVSGLTATWETIAGNEGYTVEVIKDNGTPTYIQYEKTDARSYTFAAEIGVYKIRVLAKGDGVINSNSNYSEEKTCTVTKLSQPTITFDNGTWTMTCTGAESYDVALYIEGNLTAIEETTVTNTYTYSFSGKVAGVYILKATAKSSNVTVLNSDTKSADGITKIGAPSITVNGSNFDWNAVTGATSYNVTINDGQQQSTTNTSFAIPSADGVQTIKVVAVGGANTMPSEEATTSHTNKVQLSTPEISLNAGIVTWAAIQNATSYDIYVNGEKKTSVSVLTYTAPDTVGQYIIKIKAVPTNTDLYTTSEFSNEETHTKQGKLQAPTIALNAETNVISWSAINEASSYDIYIADVKKGSTTSLSYTLSQLSLTPNQYSVTVKAIPASDQSIFLESDASNSVTYTKTETLSAPTNVTLTAQLDNDSNPIGGKISWETVTNAESYTVTFKRSGQSDIVITDTISLFIEFLATDARFSAGSYTIEVTAVHSSQYYNDSAPATEKDSKAYTLVAAATGTVFNKRDDDTKGTIRWTVDANAVSYKLTATDTNRTDSETTKTYTVASGAITFDEFLSSDYSVTIVTVGEFNIATTSATTLSYYGSGTEADPFALYSNTEFANKFVAANRGAHFELYSDVVVSDGFTLGTTYADSFYGVFNGNDHTVSGITSESGLFGYTSGIIKNLKVDGTISASSHDVGMLAKINSKFNNTVNLGLIENVVASGTITVTLKEGDAEETQYYNFGGIVGINEVNRALGQNYVAKIISSVNKVNINGIGNSVGGIAGLNKGGIEYCINKGTISGRDNVGGIAGMLEELVEEKIIVARGDIVFCGNLGAINGVGRVGGITGFNYGHIDQCYNKANVQGSWAIGGIAGETNREGDGTPNANLTNCYNTGNIVAEHEAGGISGKNNSWNTGNWGGIGQNINLSNVVQSTDVSGGDSKRGGICGKSEYQTFINCYTVNIGGEFSATKKKNEIELTDANFIDSITADNGFVITGENQIWVVDTAQTNAIDAISLAWETSSEAPTID